MLIHLRHLSFHYFHYQLAPFRRHRLAAAATLAGWVRATQRLAEMADLALAMERADFAVFAITWMQQSLGCTHHHHPKQTVRTKS